MSRYWNGAADQRSSAIYNWYNSTAEGEQLVFASSGTPDVLASGQIKMVIGQNGNVGIGTTSPGDRLTVVGGSIVAGGTTAGGYSNTIGITQGGNSNYMQVDGSGNTYFSSNHKANFIFNGGNLTVYGTSTCVIGSGTGATNGTSDQRLKNDIMPIPNALKKLALLKGVTFHWKDPKKSGPEHIGVIAQDVEKVFPQAVGSVSDSTLGTAKTVDIAALVAPMIEALKELKADNDSLRASQTSDHAAIRLLQRQINELKAAKTSSLPTLVMPSR